jgi:hypothetical protein
MFLFSNELVRKFSTIKLPVLIYLLFLYCSIHTESGWQIQYNEYVETDNPELKFQQRQQNMSSPEHTDGSVAHPQRYSGWGKTLITHLHLAARSRINAATVPFPLTPT